MNNETLKLKFDSCKVEFASRYWQTCSKRPSVLNKDAKYQVSKEAFSVHTDMYLASTCLNQVVFGLPSRHTYQNANNTYTS